MSDYYEIICPACEAKLHVGHFGWSALYCTECNQPNEQSKWMALDNFEWEGINLSFDENNKALK